MKIETLEIFVTRQKYEIDITSRAENFFNQVYDIRLQPHRIPISQKAFALYFNDPIIEMT